MGTKTTVGSICTKKAFLEREAWQLDVTLQAECSVHSVNKDGETRRFYTEFCELSI